MSLLANLVLAAALAGADNLNIHNGPASAAWTGDLVELRWGTHYIAFDAVTEMRWTDHDKISANGFEDYQPWVIDVTYNHMLRHIPMLCHIEAESYGGSYFITGDCH